MTTITREQAQAVSDLKAGYTLGHADVAILKDLARIALASLEAEPVAYIIQDADARSRGEKGILRYFANISDEDINEYEITVTPLYTAPPAPVVPEEMTMADAIMEIDAKDADRWTGRIGFQKGWNACRSAMLQGAPVRSSMPDGVVTAEHRRVIEMLLNVCGAAFELADDSCQQDVDGEECHVVPSDAFQKLSDALDEIENTLPTEDIDRPDVFLAWSAMPRAALKSLLQAGNSLVIPDGWVMVPVDMTPEQMRAVQIKSELGSYAAANLSGAYALFREFWDVSVAAAPQQEAE